MNQEFERALEACASEPIHQIGHVQPHGGLLAFSTAPRHLVHHASKNIADFIGKDIPAALNQPLSNLFEPSEIADIETLLGTSGFFFAIKALRTHSIKRVSNSSPALSVV